MFLYVTHTARALQSHDLSEEEIKLGITYILFWPHKDMEGLPGWVISSMSGHLRNRTNMKDDTHQVHTHSFEQDEYEMMIMTAKSYIRGSCGPKVSWHLSDRWGKPRKISPRNLSRRDRTRALCVTSARATTCSTTVDIFNVCFLLSRWNLYRVKGKYVSLF